MEAITLNRVVAAFYNGSELELAPHSLFGRHGALHVRAVNTNREPREDEPTKLGIFKLAGLSAVRLTERRFDPVSAHFATLVGRTDQAIFPIGGEQESPATKA